MREDNYSIVLTAYMNYNRVLFSKRPINLISLSLIFIMEIFITGKMVLILNQGSDTVATDVAKPLSVMILTIKVTEIKNVWS